MDRQTGVNLLSPLMGGAHFTCNQMKYLGELAYTLLWHLAVVAVLKLSAGGFGIQQWILDMTS